MPRLGQFNQYTHRIGRTGRVGNTGRSTTFFNILDFERDLRHAIPLVETLRSSDQEVPEFLLEIYNHQITHQEKYKPEPSSGCLYEQDDECEKFQWPLGNRETPSDEFAWDCVNTEKFQWPLGNRGTPFDDTWDSN